MFKAVSSDHVFISITYYFFRKIFGPIVKVIFVSKVYGLDNIPKSGAALLALNHQSFFDFICFSAVAPRNVHFLAAEKFFESRMWRPLMILTGQIKVERDSADKFFVHMSVKKHLQKKTLVGIFPEGTRSPHSDKMLKVFNGAAKYALEHKVPIIPVGIKGTYEIMSKHDFRPKFKKIVEINIGQPLHFHQYHGNHEDKNVCAHVMGQVVREIEVLSGKIYPHYESTK